MSTEINATPQLQSVQKAMAIPTVEAAVGQVGALYTRVKAAHALLEWALSAAEATVTLAATTAAPYVAAPLAAGDAHIAKAIDQLENRIPLMKEQPKVIIDRTTEAIVAKIAKPVYRVQTARANAQQKVQSLKDLSWAKANTLLATPAGQMALHGVDSGAAMAMQLLDTYLPHIGAEAEVNGEIVAVSSDPALHTVQTVGRLSAVAARRLWANLAYRVNQLRTKHADFDVRRYITALVAALQLARVINQAQPSVDTQSTVQPKETQSQSTQATEETQSQPTQAAEETQSQSTQTSQKPVTPTQATQEPPMQAAQKPKLNKSKTHNKSGNENN